MNPMEQIAKLMASDAANKARVELLERDLRDLRRTVNALLLKLAERQISQLSTLNPQPTR